MKALVRFLVCYGFLFLPVYGNKALSQNISVNAYANQNLTIDPYGRVMDLFFDKDVSIIAPWERFRFTIDMVRPLARDGGAFLGDLNNDGVDDLLIATFDGQLIFYPGTEGNYEQFGNGSYIKFSSDTPGDDPYFNIGSANWLQGDIADIDGDGKNEIIAGSKIYRNISNSSLPILELVYDFNSTWDPAATIGDLNGDGKPDIVISQSYTLSTNIYWNNSTPGTYNFTTEALTTWASNSARDNHLSLADLNGDKLLDLAGPAGIYYNTGSGQVPHFDFSTPSPWNKSGGPSWSAGSDQPPHIYLKDVNKDGLLEAFASNLSSTTWQVLYYKNKGTSASHQFEYVGPLVVNSTPLNLCYRGDSLPSFSPNRGFVATADIDSNSFEDVLMSISGGESFGAPTILWNFKDTKNLSNNLLTFQDLYTYPQLNKITTVCDFFNSYCDYLIKPANLFSAWYDFTNDQLPDFIYCDQFMDAYNLYLVTRNGVWPFARGTSQSIISQPSGIQATAYGVVLIDIDKDGYKDLVGGTVDGKLKYYRNLATDGTLSLADPVYLSDLSGNPLVLGTQSWPTAIDLNGDGVMDFLVATEDGLIHKVICVSQGVANGYSLDGLLGSSEQNPVNVTHIIGGGTITPSITAIDIDKDGLQDIVMADASGPSWLLHNSGSKTAPVFSLQPLIVSKTNSANLEKIDNRHYRVYFALPTISEKTKLSFNGIKINDTPVSGEAVITAPIFHDVLVSLNTPNSGIITGSGTYNHGQTVYLTAEAESGYSFVNWTENGIGVSTNKVFSFIATSDRNLVANFQIQTGIENIFEKGSVTIFPNPSKGNFTIGLDNNYFGEILIRIHSVTGNLSKTEKINKTTHKADFMFDIGNMGEGVYFIDLQTKKEKITKMIVIN